MKHIIFDYDGVLVDSFNFHLSKINGLYKIDLTAEEYRSSHDGNFYASKLDKWTAIDFSEYAQRVSKNQAKLPVRNEVKDVLIVLAEHYQLHVITSGWKIQVLPFLENNGIIKLFTTLQYAEDGTSKYEKLHRLLESQNALPHECIFVTDTLGDLLESHKVNIPTIAVTFGYHSEDHLKEGNPTYVAHSFLEIKEILISFEHYV